MRKNERLVHMYGTYFFTITILFVLCSLFLVFLPCSATSTPSNQWGTVSGKVTVLQKKVFGGLKEKRHSGQTVVYISGFKTQTPNKIFEIKQEGKRFVPSLLPIVVGQTVRFPNHDPIYHNVFSISPLAPFDLGQYKGTTAPKSVTFTEYGVIPVFCNIHPEMIAYVVVLENDAHALTGKNGEFTINHLPEGSFTINAWRPKAKRVSKKITVQAGQTIEVNLEMAEKVKIKPHRRKDGSFYPSDTGHRY